MSAPTQDSLAIALLCTQLGLPRGSDLRPLTDLEFGTLAGSIASSELRRPASLFQQDASGIAHALGIGSDAADRIHRLLQRGTPLALELERLQTLGIWLMTRADGDYPSLLRARLERRMPSVLFGMGRRELVTTECIAVVGSRDLPDEAAAAAVGIGGLIGAAGLTVVSGGSRGADSLAMQAAMDRGGSAVGVLSEGLERVLRDRDARGRVLDGSLTMISPYPPSAGFTPGHAMARNKIVYCLSRLAIVVSSGVAKGGTWTGATEALQAGWVPVYVRSSAQDMGSAALIDHGAVVLPFDPMTEEEPFVSLLQAGPDGPGANGTESDGELHSLEEAWPRLVKLLEQQQTSVQVARALHVTPVHATAWLRDAYERGLLTRSGSPVAYRLAQPDDGLEQMSIPL